MKKLVNDEKRLFGETIITRSLLSRSSRAFASLCDRRHRKRTNPDFRWRFAAEWCGSSCWDSRPAGWHASSTGWSYLQWWARVAPWPGYQSRHMSPPPRTREVTSGTYHHTPPETRISTINIVAVFHFFVWRCVSTFVLKIFWHKNLLDLTDASWPERSVYAQTRNLAVRPQGFNFGPQIFFQALLAENWMILKTLVPMSLLSHQWGHPMLKDQEMKLEWSAKVWCFQLHCIFVLSNPHSSVDFDLLKSSFVSSEEHSNQIVYLSGKESEYFLRDVPAGVAALHRSSEGWLDHKVDKTSTL